MGYKTDSQPWFSWSATCALCGTWRDTNKQTLEEAVQETKDAGWIVHRAGSICVKCQDIRKQTFLEAAEIAENHHPVYHKAVMEIAELLREKAEEQP